MQWLAQRATSKEWLHWDLPLQDVEIGWALSASGHLTATVDASVGKLTASDGRPLLDEWGTLLFAVEGETIRWGGLIATSHPDGDGWLVEAASISSYPHSRVYRGDYVAVDRDPAVIIRDIWSYLQETPGGNLGVRVDGSSPVRVGQRGYALRDGSPLWWEIPHQQWARLYEAGWRGGALYYNTTPDDLRDWLLDYARFERTGDGWIVPGRAYTDNAELSPYEVELLTHGWAGGPATYQDIGQTTWTALIQRGWANKVDGATNEIWSPAQNARYTEDGDQIVEPAPYRLKPWEAKDCGKEIADLASNASIEWVERYEWDGETVTPVIALGYPRAGRVREDLVFALDENVTAATYTSSLSDNHANTVVGLGAGSGGRTLLEVARRDDGRVARDYVLSDQSVTDSRVLRSMSEREVSRRSASGVEVTEVTLLNHGNAPFGSWECGDDILVRTKVPVLGEVEVLSRVTGWTLKDGVATVALKRSDSWQYPA